jgi:hypothetical protein
MEDEHFMQAVAQTVDALTFAQTHVVDCDFRAHSKSTADSVASLQNEQRSRVDHTFGAIGASPEYLAGVLLAMYRGEAAAVAVAKEQGQECAMLDKMSDAAARAFKKEMKQRIHEWEGAFREKYQQEAAPNDKIVLRPIYELYKCAKARVLRLEQAAPSGESNQRVQSAPPAVAAQVTPARPDFHEVRYSNPVVRQSPIQPSTPQSSFTPTAAVRSAGSAAANYHAEIGGPTPPAAPAAPMSMDELANEKRKLKRILHQFESDFEARFGRKPTKDDRRDYAKEYNRYGELKSLLNESGKALDN